MRYANLALRFGLELAGLAAFCYWGFTVADSVAVKLLLGLGTPVVAAVLWGVFASPKAAVRMPNIAAQVAFEVVWFGAAVAALAAAGRVTSAVVLAALYVVNRSLMVLWRQ